MLQVPPTHTDILGSFWSGKKAKYDNLLTDTSTSQKHLHERVCNSHWLPVHGSPAEQVASYQYLGSAEINSQAEMTHKLSCD